MCVFCFFSCAEWDWNILTGEETYQAPVPGGPPVIVDPKSTRLQLLEPFTAFNGEDIKVTNMTLAQTMNLGPINPLETRGPKLFSSLCFACINHPLPGSLERQGSCLVETGCQPF